MSVLEDIMNYLHLKKVNVVKRILIKQELKKLPEELLIAIWQDRVGVLARFEKLVFGETLIFGAVLAELATDPNCPNVAKHMDMISEQAAQQFEKIFEKFK